MLKIVSEQELERLFEEIDEKKQARAEKMPDEKAALKQMFEAHLRLKELGWNESIYCPKDGSVFSAIEAGSTGVHKCKYDGEWPTGSWWILDGDMWPSRPILWRPRKDGDPDIDHGTAMDYCCADQHKDKQ